MYPTEPREQDVLFTANGLLRQALEHVPGAPAQNATRSEISGLKRQQEAALLHRHGRLRAIQALHRQGK